MFKYLKITPYFGSPISDAIKHLISRGWVFNVFWNSEPFNECVFRMTIQLLQKRKSTEALLIKSVRRNFFLHTLEVAYIFYHTRCARIEARVPAVSLYALTDTHWTNRGRFPVKSCFIDFALQGILWPLERLTFKVIALLCFYGRYGLSRKNCWIISQRLGIKPSTNPGDWPQHLLFRISSSSLKFLSALSLNIQI